MFTLKPLPFSYDALAPYMSERTLKLHHGKHHQAYLNNLNDLLPKALSELDLGENPQLLDIVQKSHEMKLTAIFNNAGQVWNHDFFWSSLSPNGGGEPAEEYLTHLINLSFGDYKTFCELFSKQGLSQFGSGWVWLCYDKKTGNLVVSKTSNADNPFMIEGEALVPLAVCDVWEHAYYVDYENRRGEFIEIFLKNLINWDFIHHNLQQIKVK